jgi:hypothetical protein
MDNLKLGREKKVENYGSDNNALDQTPELKQLSNEELSNILGYDRGVLVDW